MSDVRVQTQKLQPELLLILIGAMRAGYGRGPGELGAGIQLMCPNCGRVHQMLVLAVHPEISSVSYLDADDALRFLVSSKV